MEQRKRRQVGMERTLRRWHARSLLHTFRRWRLEAHRGKLTALERTEFAAAEAWAGAQARLEALLAERRARAELNKRRAAASCIQRVWRDHRWRRVLRSVRAAHVAKQTDAVVVCAQDGEVCPYCYPSIANYIAVF